MTLACCYIMWVCVYMAQLHPLIRAYAVLTWQNPRGGTSVSLSSRALPSKQDGPMYYNRASMACVGDGGYASRPSSGSVCHRWPGRCSPHWPAHPRHPWA